MPSVAANIPSMINGTGSHTGTSSGLKDWINQYRPNDPTNVSIFVTEFGYTGSVTNSTTLADHRSRHRAFRRGFLFHLDELRRFQHLLSGDEQNAIFGRLRFSDARRDLLRHQIVACDGRSRRHLCQSTSDTSTVRVQAALQQNGNVGLVLLNENRTTPQTVNVTITNASLSSTGIQYQLGTNNFTGTQRDANIPAFLQYGFKPGQFLQPDPASLQYDGSGGSGVEQYSAGAGRHQQSNCERGTDRRVYRERDGHGSAAANIDFQFVEVLKMPF